jgi:hypothetical protein
MTRAAATSAASTTDRPPPLPVTEETNHGVTPPARHRSELYIGGRWIHPHSDEVLRVVSPSTEETIATVPAATPR